MNFWGKIGKKVNFYLKLSKLVMSITISVLIVHEKSLWRGGQNHPIGVTLTTSFKVIKKIEMRNDKLAVYFLLMSNISDKSTAPYWRLLDHSILIYIDENGWINSGWLWPFGVTLTTLNSKLVFTCELLFANFGLIDTG